MLKWEKLDDAYPTSNGEWRPEGKSNPNHGKGTWRTKIPGGWLVRFGYKDASGDNHPMVFTPDVNHAWDGSSLD